RVAGYLNQHWIAGADATLPDDFRFPDKEAGEGFPLYASIAILNPSKTIEFSFPIELFFIQRARKKEVALFYYGHVDYRDVFGRNQELDFVGNIFPWSVALAIAWSLTMSTMTQYKRTPACLSHDRKDRR